jgi:PST family polysaccharide transporter
VGVVNGEPSTPTGGLSLRGKALSGFFWSYGGALSGRITFFAATLILARLLSPSDFGLVAFTVAILSFVDNLTDLGVGQALVYRSDGTNQDVASTAFWVGLAGSVAAVALVWALAPLFSHLGADPQVVPIFLVLCLQFPLRALGSVHRYVAMHALEFKKLVLTDFLSQITRGGLSVALALAGAGVWSLVLGTLAGTLVWTISMWFATGWRPSLVVRRAYVRSLVGFGFSITFIGVVGYASHNIDYVIVGARLGKEQLGFYFLAFRIPEIAILEIFLILQSILFPYFSRLQESPRSPDTAVQDLSRMASAYRQALRLTALIAFPLGFGMAALALPLVLVVYGAEWRPSAVPLAFVSIWAAFSALASLPATSIKALGRGKLLTQMAAIEVGLTVPVLWLIAPFGIGFVAAALLGIKLVYLVIQSFVVRRVLGVSCLAQAGSTIRGLFASLVMAALLFPLGRVTSPPVALAVGVPAGAIVYLGLLRIFFNSELKFVVALLPDRLRARWMPV